MSENSGCGVPFGTVRIADFYFVDGAVIVAEAMIIISEAFVSLSEKAESLELRILWITTKL